MKKLFLMFAVASILVSCGEKSTEKEGCDSTSCCDSTAAVVVDSTASVAPVDSLKTDSAAH